MHQVIKFFTKAKKTILAEFSRNFWTFSKKMKYFLKNLALSAFDPLRP